MTHLQRFALTAVALLGLAGIAQAQTADGIVLINQAAVDAGGISSCDDPGYPVTICDTGSVFRSAPGSSSRSTKSLACSYRARAMAGVNFG